MISYTYKIKFSYPGEPRADGTYSVIGHRDDPNSAAALGVGVASAPGSVHEVTWTPPLDGAGGQYAPGPLVPSGFERVHDILMTATPPADQPVHRDLRDLKAGDSATVCVYAANEGVARSLCTITL